MRLLVTAWRETTRGVRALCLVLWGVGIIATVLGGWGDAVGWWNNKNFLSNLASSATGALFGVPFALVVVQHITARQADERERREVRYQALQLARELAADARQLVRVEAHPQAVATLRAALREARTALDIVRSGGDADTPRPAGLAQVPAHDNPRPAGLAQVPAHDPAALGQAYTRWNELVSSRATTEMLIERMSANWRSLLEDARPRLLRLGLTWPDRQLVELFDEDISGGLAGGADLLWMDDFPNQAGAEFTAARLRQGREAEAHLRRINQADEYLRGAERVSRYADEIWRVFANQ
jgi:hypothetical protein